MNRIKKVIFSRYLKNDNLKKTRRNTTIAGPNKLLFALSSPLNPILGVGGREGKLILPKGF